MKKKILLIIGIIIVILLSCFIVFIKTNNKNDTIVDEKAVVDEYYIKMHSIMAKYYKIKYRHLNVKVDKDTPVGITLRALSNDGFPIEEFVSYDKKDKCDLDLSYAVIKYENNKEITYVYYKCGEDANYDYKEYQKILEEREK